MSSPSLAHKLNSALESCVIIDVETTGLEPKDHKIIEVATLTVCQGEVVDLRSWLLNPEEKISQFITDLTGITNAHVQDCPTFPAVAPEIMRVLTPPEPHTHHNNSQTLPPTLVGHNVAFDYSFLQHELLRRDLNQRTDTHSVALTSSVSSQPSKVSGGSEPALSAMHNDPALSTPYTPPLLCTAESARSLIPRSAVGRYRLDSVAAFLSTPHRPRHRAAVDVQATFDVLRGLTRLALDRES